MRCVLATTCCCGCMYCLQDHIPLVRKWTHARATYLNHRSYVGVSLFMREAVGLCYRESQPERQLCVLLLYWRVHHFDTQSHHVRSCFVFEAQFSGWRLLLPCTFWHATLQQFQCAVASVVDMFREVQPGLTTFVS